MAKEILMPRQGNTVESCILLEWKVQEGDEIEAGDVVCEVETDKATFEVESDFSGTVLNLLRKEDDEVPVLKPIALVGEPDEDVSDYVTEGTVAPAKEETQPIERKEIPEHKKKQPEEPKPANGYGSILAISPRAKNLAEVKGVDYSSLQGSGPGGRIIERDIQQVLGAGEPLTPTAIEEKLASGRAAPAEGTGIGGRVTVQDVREYQPTGPAPGKEDLEYPGPLHEKPVRGVRKLIAERMHESLQSTAQLTLDSSADARNLLAYRKKLKGSIKKLNLHGITINDIVLYSTIKTLLRYPSMNAHFEGETIKEFEHVHMAFAVDTDRGLMVPVIRFADDLSLKDLSAETKRLRETCQAGNANPDELQGGTFTVTNLGTLGIESFTPVLNPPQVGILGVNAIKPKPVIQGDDFEFIPHIGLSLTIDHQGVDGAPAARFLKDLCNDLANFELMLAV
jgi:pyruvate dehydrogenase E2 component (dihydrolipoamide acetyltransferase)